MQEQLPELLQVCKVGLGDQESRVQRVTLRLLSAVIGLENTLPEPMSLLDVMPALFLVGDHPITHSHLSNYKHYLSSFCHDFQPLSSRNSSPQNRALKSCVEIPIIWMHPTHVRQTGLPIVQIEHKTAQPVLDTSKVLSGLPQSVM